MGGYPHCTLGLNPILVDEVVYAKTFRRLHRDRLLTLLPDGLSVFAGPVEDSIKAYRSGDYKTAYQLIKPQAEKGDANAQFILGFLYDEGKGVPQDYTEAAKWYRRAAEQGNKAARHNLGLMGEQDQVWRDRAEMQKWHQRAAEQGNTAAQPTRSHG